MAQAYIEYSFTVVPKIPGTEILMAELAEVGFDSFEENDTGLSAYIPSENNHDNLLKDIQVLNSEEFSITYTVKTIQQENWNTQWESEFQPLAIDDTCRIRASFHPYKEVEYDIVINPKMAFGTGHHATTHLMVQFLLQNNLKDKTVLDMGCGTGVLSVLASMKQAEHVDAIDIDPWSYKNTLENINLNQCQNITAHKGGADLLKNKHYDVILANITRNVLLNDMATYAQCLSKNGDLFLSGFFKNDLTLIDNCCQEMGLTYKAHKNRDQWMAVWYIKD